MKVIGNVGINNKKMTKCYICGSLIEYEDKELFEGLSYDHTLDMDIWSKYFFCPVCNQKLVINEEKLGSF